MNCGSSLRLVGKSRKTAVFKLFNKAITGKIRRMSEWECRI